MFWSSVLGGLKILGHWQVWVALIAYTVLNWLWLFGIGLFIGNDNSGGRIAIGCLTHMIGGIIFQAILVSLLIFYLIPIMLGGDNAMPLVLFPKLIWPITKAGLIATIIVLIISFIPILGGFITNTPGLEEFIEGIIIFRIFSASIVDSLLKRANLPTNIYPGFWYFIGYFIIALAITYAGFLLTTIIKGALRNNYYNENDSIIFLFMPAIIRFLGLLPLFMYTQYTAQILRFIPLTQL